MAFSRDKFGLLWSVPPDGVDRDNLRRSGVRLVEVTFNIATEALVDMLASAGVRTICARLNEGDYYTADARRATADRVARLMPKGLTHVQIGCEPENAQDMRFGSRSWGQEQAYLHGNATREMYLSLFALGVKTISAGWTERGWYRNWDEGVQPGVYPWLEETRLAYNDCDYNGAHLYMSDGTTYDIEERARAYLWEEQARRHKPLWIDELGVTPSVGDNLAKMGIYLRFASYLLRTDRRTPLGGAGERVEALIPFVSNGNGIGWDPRFILRDPAAYDLLGAWIRGTAPFSANGGAP